MRSLLNLILKYYFTILFILLEAVSVFLIFQTNNFHKSTFRNKVDAVSSSIGEKVNVLNNYLRLRHINEKLIDENEELRNKLKEYYIAEPDTFKVLKDTTRGKEYKFIKARIINKSANKQYNYLTINRGKLDNIKPEMAVMSSNGVVGIVQGVSDHFATIIPVINLDFRLSAKLQKNDYFGSLIWDGKNHRKALLKEIPYHVNIKVGDVITTSRYSNIFPEGIPIGTISDYNVEQGNFYKIIVRLSADFKRLSYVYVIDYQLKEEQKQLEKKLKDD